MPTKRTHEDYVASIYNIALKQPGLSPSDRAKLRKIKLVYGAGPDGTRGVTYFNRWQPKCTNGHHHHPKPAKAKKMNGETVPFVAICATGQESHVQVCGTVLHELGHVLSDIGVGHGPAWHDNCAKLGLIDILAAGTDYQWKNFEPELAKRLQRLPLPNDGAPVAPIGTGLWGNITVKLRPCGAGFGTRGGVYKGAGSKSRLLLWECSCEPKPKKIRHAGHDLKAKCLDCKCMFELIEASLPPTQQADRVAAV